MSSRWYPDSGGARLASPAQVPADAGSRVGRHSIAQRNRHVAEAMSAYVICGALGVPLLLHDPGALGGWILTTWFLFVTTLAVNALPHELAHAWTSQLLGLRVHHIVIGVGWPLGRLRLLGIDVLVRILPLGGVTSIEAAPVHLRHRRVRLIASYAAGPLANIVLGMLAFATFLWDATRLPNRFGLHYVAAVYVMSSFFAAAYNLIPAFVAQSGQKIANDGLAIARELRVSSGTNDAMAQASRSGDGVCAVMRWAAARITRPLGIVAAVACLLQLVRAITDASYRAGLLAAGGAAVALAVISYWLTVRGEGAETGPGVDGSDGHGVVRSRIVHDLRAQPRWAGELQVVPLLGPIDQQIGAQRFAEARRDIDAASVSFPDSFLLALRRVRLLVVTGRSNEAWALLDSLSRTAISSATLTLARAEYFSTLLSAGTVTKAMDEIRAYVSSATDSAEVCCLLDHVATGVLMRRDRELLRAAEQCAGLALEVEPRSMPLKATRGALLVELGELDRGQQLLEEILEHGDVEADVGLAALFLAVCASRRGHRGKVRRFARRARLLLREDWCEQRLGELRDASS